MTELEQYIQGYFGIHQNDLEQISQLFEPTTLTKSDFFVHANASCTKLSFVKSGYLRVYDYANDKDVTQWIVSSGEFVTDLSSIVFQQPARWNIQAVTDCELYTISAEDYRNIGKLIPSWPQMEKLFITKCFLTLEHRVFSFLSMSAESRYQDLFGRNADLFNQIPLHYIASMLGMTPETLSRIRKKSTS